MILHQLAVIEDLVQIELIALLEAQGSSNRRERQDRACKIINNMDDLIKVVKEEDRYQAYQRTQSVSWKLSLMAAKTYST